MCQYLVVLPAWRVLHVKLVPRDWMSQKWALNELPDAHLYHHAAVSSTCIGNLDADSHWGVLVTYRYPNTSS